MGNWFPSSPYSNKKSKYYIKVQNRWKNVPLTYEVSTPCYVTAIFPISVIPNDFSNPDDSKKWKQRVTNNKSKIMKHLKSKYKQYIIEDLHHHDTFTEACDLSDIKFNVKLIDQKYAGEDSDYLFTHPNKKVYAIELTFTISNIKEDTRHATDKVITNMEQIQDYAIEYKYANVSNSDFLILLASSQFYIEEFTCSKNNP